MRHFLQIEFEAFLFFNVFCHKCCTLLYFILSRLNEVEPQLRLDVTLAPRKFSLLLDTCIPGDYCLPDVRLTLYHFYFGFGILALKGDYFFPCSIGSGHFSRC